jgi:ADP-heptose:LPS heptosyltransferase
MNSRQSIDSYQTTTEDIQGWINPIGGLGDMLMLSGILKLVIDKHPQVCFNLVRRTRYQQILKGHPALRYIGSPPVGANIIGTDYWAREKLGAGNFRAFQILARMFHLTTPIEEKLFISGNIDETDPLCELIPWKIKPVALIAPNSDSPRKMIHPMNWHRLVDQLMYCGFFVIQVGRRGEQHIRNAYSLIGLTTPRQVISMAKKCRVLITVDNFIMHVGHLVEIPTVVMWGPTDHKVYGYPEQIHLQAPLDHCALRDECLGPGNPQNYNSICPQEKSHCMNMISMDIIIDTIANKF